MGTHRPTPVGRRSIVHHAVPDNEKSGSVNPELPPLPGHKSTVNSESDPPLRRSARLLAGKSDPNHSSSAKSSSTPEDESESSDSSSSARHAEAAAVSSPPSSAEILKDSPRDAAPPTPPNDFSNLPQRPAGPTGRRTTNLVLQWNVKGLYSRLGELEILVRDHEPTVIALQETNRVDKVGINAILGGKYRWHTRRGQPLPRSIAIGVLRNVPHELVYSDPELPILGVRIESPIPVTIVCAYLPPGKLTDLAGRLAGAIDPLKDPKIFVGDINAHHPNWGQQTADSRGKIVAEYFEETGLTVLNDGTNTFFNGRSSSAIDVAATSLNLAGKLTWTKASDLHGSDHYPCLTTLNAPPPDISRRPRWKFAQADWPGFSATVDELIETRRPSNPDEITEILREAAVRTIPKSSSKPGKKALRWWSSDIKREIKKRRKLLRASKRIPNGDPRKEDVLEQYRGQNILVRKMVRKAKLDSWTEFLESINDEHTAAELWSRVNSLNGKKKARPPILLHDGRYFDRPADTANILGEYFSAMSSICEYNDKFIRRQQADKSAIARFLVPTDFDNAPFNRPFTMEELTFALRSTKGESTGPDEIGYRMLKNLSTTAKATLLEAFNSLWTTNTFPVGWRESIVVPIPKTGQAKDTVKGYRPISLTSCTAKTMERLVNRRLRDFLTEKDRLDHRQFAFRPGSGTNLYFAALGDLLADARENGQHVELVSLDLSKAYNRTWTPLVLKKLAEWGVNGNMMFFLKNYLLDRSFRVAVSGTYSRPFCEETGIPQGSVLAVTLFLIAMNSLFDVLPKGVYVFVYADDILLVAVGDDHNSPRRKIQWATNAVYRWAEEHGFTISAPKSARTTVCRVKHNDSKYVTAGGTKIPNRKTIKILGVILDSSLSFRIHCDAVKESCKTRINLLKTISKRHRTNNRDIRLRVAKATINSRLLYGLELTCLGRENVKKILGPVYNTSLRIVSGLLPSTPADSVCAEIGVLPFSSLVDTAIVSRTAGFLAKTSGTGKTHLATITKDVLQQVTVPKKRFPIVARISWNGPIRWNRARIKIDNHIRNRFRAGDNSVALRKTFIDRVRERYGEYDIRYTDGSRTDAGVGYGVHSSESGLNISKRLHGYCSSFSAETAGIFEAIAAPATRPILVVSDSASAIDGLQSEVPKHPWIQAIMTFIPEDTVIMWVPGHCGVTGNERADRLAATGHQGEYLSREVPLEDVRAWNKRLFRADWDTKWFREKDRFLRKIKQTTSRFRDTKNLKDQQVLSRLRTGHTRLSHNLGGGQFLTNCNLCGLRKSVEHILCVCPIHEDLRVRHNLPNNVDAVLGEDQDTETALLDFLREADLYYQI